MSAVVDAKVLLREQAWDDHLLSPPCMTHNTPVRGGPDSKQKPPTEVYNYLMCWLAWCDILRCRY